MEGVLLQILRLPWFAAMLLLALLIGTLLLVVTVIQSRRHLRNSDRLACSRCGAVHPRFALFCRNCGQRMT